MAIDWKMLGQSLPGVGGNPSVGEFWGDELGFGDAPTTSGGEGNFWTDLWGGGKQAFEDTMLKAPKKPHDMFQMFGTPDTAPQYPEMPDNYSRWNPSNRPKSLFDVKQEEDMLEMLYNEGPKRYPGGPDVEIGRFDSLGADYGNMPQRGLGSPRVQPVQNQGLNKQRSY